MDILFDNMIRQRSSSNSYNSTSVPGNSPEDFEDDEYGGVSYAREHSPRFPKISISDVQWMGE